MRLYIHAKSRTPSNKGTIHFKSFFILSIVLQFNKYAYFCDRGKNTYILLPGFILKRQKYNNRKIKDRFALAPVYV